MKKVTLKDIANELNVTIGTVSHALNGMSDISEETKKRVFDTAEKMGYISNNAAVSLRSGKTNTIAIIVPDISNPHIAYQIKLIEGKMRKQKYSVIILNTDENEKAEYNAIVAACGKQVDGIMLCPSQHSKKNIAFLKKMNIPFILIGRYFSDYETDYICADDVKGGRLAGEYLRSNGYKKPIYFGAYKYIEASLNRYTGLAELFTDYPVKFVEISPNPESLKSVIEKEFSDDFDSIVAFSDLIAYKIYDSLRKITDKKIPIIGFDAINRHLNIPFESISVGMVGNGWADMASEILIKKMKGTSEIFHELIDVKLYINDC